MSPEELEAWSLNYKRDLDTWVSAAANTAHERNMARKERDRLKAEAETRLAFIDGLEASYDRLAMENARLCYRLGRAQKALELFCNWCKTPEVVVTPEVIEAQHEALAIVKKGATL